MSELSFGEAENWVDFVERQIGYKFVNRDLLVQAFVRKSYSMENGGENNEVLEFIGDKALDLSVGINNLLKNAYKPAPTPSNLTIPSPKAISAPNTNGHTNNNTTDTRIETTPATMATHLLPLKNDNQSGNLVSLNLL